MRLRACIVITALAVLPAAPGCIFVVGRHEDRSDVPKGTVETRWWEDDGSTESKSDSSADSKQARGRRDRKTVGDASAGPFSEGVLSGPFFFASGQIPRDAETGAVVTNDIERGTRLVLEGLSATLERAGLSLEDVVKVTVFLRDIRDYDAMNRVYAEFFAKEPPARSTVAVAALARDAVMEVELIAVRR